MTAVAVPTADDARAVGRRLGGSPELDDLDLDTDLGQSVTVVEWGSGLVEELSADRLELTLTADPATEARSLEVVGRGRWATEVDALVTYLAGG